MLILPTGADIFYPPGVAYLYTLLVNRYGTLEKGRKIFEELDQRAIEIKFSVGREFLSVTLSALNSQLEKGLEYLKEFLTQPNLRKEVVEQVLKERDEIIRTKENSKDYLARKLLYQIAFPNTPLAHPIEGEPNQKITLSQLEEYFKKGITSAGSYLLVVGKKVTPDRFNYLGEGRLEPLPKFTPVQAQKTQYTQTEQAYIQVLSPFHFEPEKWYLQRIAFNILGAGGFGSRIMEEIRVKRGLAYSAYGYVRVRKIYSIFRAYLQTKISNREEAISLLKKVIEEFITRGATQKELEDAKKFLIGSEPLREETPMQRLFIRFREIYFGFGEGFYQRQLKLIEKTTLPELNAYIKHHKEIGKLTIATITAPGGN
jgi:predicted Zn-dependent peptidase